MSSEYYDLRLDWFRSERPWQFKAAWEILETFFEFDSKGDRKVKSKYCALWAKLKWGKREVLDILPRFIPDVKCIYLYPPRKDLEPQTKELSHYGWTIDRRQETIIENYDKDKFYLVALDEADWGDGSNQSFEKRFKPIKDLPNVVLLGVSATNLTFLYNLEKNGFLSHCVIGNSYPEYIGLEKFTYVTVDERPFDKNGKITVTFEKVLREWLRSAHLHKKTKFIVRDTKFNLKQEENVQEQLEKLCKEECGNTGINVKVVHQDNSYKWKKKNDDAWREEGKQLFIVKQTFTRGTETDIQPFLYGYYDYRGKNTALNTIAQALGRFPNYKNISDIKLYISEEHKEYVDFFLKLEEEIYNKKSITKILAEQPEDIILTGKLKKSSGKTESYNQKWKYDWDNVIVTDDEPTKFTRVTNFDFELTNNKGRQNIIDAVNRGTSYNGRWNKSDKDGTQASEAFLIIKQPPVEYKFSAEEEHFLNDKNLKTKLAKHKYTIVKASPIIEEWYYDYENYELVPDLISFKKKHSYRMCSDDPNKNGTTSYTYFNAMRKHNSPHGGTGESESEYWMIIEPNVMNYILSDFDKKLLGNKIIDELNNGNIVAIKGTAKTSQKLISNKINDKSCYPQTMN